MSDDGDKAWCTLTGKPQQSNTRAPSSRRPHKVHCARQTRTRRCRATQATSSTRATETDTKNARKAFKMILRSSAKAHEPAPASWCALAALVLLANCCLLAASFQVVSMKQQQQQQVNSHISKPPAGPAQPQEQSPQQQQQQQAPLASAKPASAKANHRLVSKLKDARHRRRNRHQHHRRHHRHYQKAMQQQQQQQQSALERPPGHKEGGAAAAFAPLTSSNGAGGPADSAGQASTSSTALTALESIVEEVARAGVQQLASVAQAAPTATSQAGAQLQPAQQAQQAQQAPASSPSVSGADLLLGGPAAPASSGVQAPGGAGGAHAAPAAPAAGITRGPLHSTRSFLLTSTLSKIYNLLNVTEFALEMRDGISSRASCVACNAVVGLFLSPLYSKEVFSAAIRTVCVSFRIQSARVCAGLVESFQDDFEYIRKNTKLTRDEICGVVFGVDCARRQTNNLFWTIPIPEPVTGALAGQQPSTSAPPAPSDNEHALGGLDDAPDLFEYRRSHVFVGAPSSPAASYANSSAAGEQRAEVAADRPAKPSGEHSAPKLDGEQTSAAHAQLANKESKSGKALYALDDQGAASEHDDKVAPKKMSSFVHLTDIHIDPYYEPGALNDCNEPLCCRATSGPLPAAADKRRQAGRWGDYGNCDVPVRTLRNALQRISEKHSDADYWLWTGDISPHDIWNISKGEAAQHVRLVTKMVRDYSNGLPVFPVIGNHEAHPVNSFSPPEIKGKFSMSWLYDLLADEWSQWLPDEALRTLRIGGYYKLKVRKGLRILALNTNYCARLNPWSFFDPVDPAGQLRWLVDELLEAELKHDKVHIIGHVPPDNRECTQSWLFNFINIVDRFRDTILAQFYGHTHRDEWRVVYSLARADEPIGIQYIGPSITPFTENNPAYRIYHQDKLGRIHDSETYYFNLTEANATPNGEPKWRFSYSNRHHLNMTQGLTAHTFHNYLSRLHDDDDAFDMFYKNFYRFSDVKSNGQVCKNKCKQQILSDLRLSHPYKTKPKPFLANRKTSNHHHYHHHHHHHRRLKHQERSSNYNL